MPTDAPAVAAPQWARIVIPTDYMLFHVGYLGALPLLPVILRSLLGSHQALAVGVVLTLYNLTIGISCLGVLPVLSRMDFRAVMSRALICSSVGIALLPFANSAPTAAIALMIAGSGMSIHGVLARSMIAQAVPSDGSRHRIYSSIQIGVNVSAAIGPLIATSVYAVWGDKAVLWGSASFYILATILVRARIPHGFHLADEGRRWPISRQTMRQVFLDRVNIQACLATLIGYFLYAQFFSAIALLVTIFVPKGPIQGFLFFENAVLVVALQPPASRIVERKLHAGTSASRVMITGMAIFSVALMVLGVALSLGLSVFAAALIGIAIFSLAETVYTPTVNTAFARIQASSPLESFNVQQVLMAAGQAGGTLVGTTIFLSLAAHSTGVPYWIILGTAGLAAAAGSWLVKVRKTEGEGATA